LALRRKCFVRSSCLPKSQCGTVACILLLYKIADVSSQACMSPNTINARNFESLTVVLCRLLVIKSGMKFHQAELAILTLSSPKGPKSGQVVKFVAKRELIVPSSGSVDVGFRWPGCVQLHSDDI